MADVCCRSVPVLGDGLDYDSYARGAVAFVCDLFVVYVRVLACRFLYASFDIVVGNVVCFRLEYYVLESRVGFGIGKIPENRSLAGLYAVILLEKRQVMVEYSR